MTNFIQRGNTVTLTAPYAVTSGQAALVGSIFGLAATDIDNGAEGEFALEGVVDITKSTEVDFAQGDKVYWHATARQCADSDSSDSYLIGTCVVAAGISAITVRVRLNGIAIVS
jgi:predicted RecA/RadA family phage recombinase